MMMSHILIIMLFFVTKVFFVCFLNSIMLYIKGER